MIGIEINISDHQLLGVKRKVEIRGFQMLWSEGVIKVFTMCKHYTKTDSNEHGDHINTQSLGDFERLLTATNERKVNNVDGIEVRQDEQGTWKRIDNNQMIESDSVIGQFDFFDQLIKSKSVNIPAILTNVILVEDLIYKSFDK